MNTIRRRNSQLKNHQGREGKAGSGVMCSLLRREPAGSEEKKQLRRIKGTGKTRGPAMPAILWAVMKKGGAVGIPEKRLAP